MHPHVLEDNLNQDFSDLLNLPFRHLSDRPIFFFTIGASASFYKHIHGESVRRINSEQQINLCTELSEI
jgi:hypothetical protein